MAIQSQFYSGTSLEVRTFPSSKHIATKQHMAIWIQQVSDDVWVQANVDTYQLINNSCVLNVLLNTVTYKQLEVRVADTPDELGLSPSDISIVAGIADEVVAVSNNEENINIVGEDLLKGIGTNQPTDSAILNALTNATDAAASAAEAAASAAVVSLDDGYSIFDSSANTINIKGGSAVLNELRLKNSADALFGYIGSTATSLRLAAQADANHGITITKDGATALTYDGADKLVTTTGGVDITGNIVISGTVDGRDIDADGTKLDTIDINASATVAGLTDTTITSPSDGQSLTYDFASGKWINSTPAGGGDLVSTNNLSDVASQQTALNNVTNVTAGTNEYVLTKDTSTGNVLFKAVTNASHDHTRLFDIASIGANVTVATNNAFLKSSGFTKLNTTSTGVQVTGNIVISGTVDGVDIAAEETRLANTSGTNTGDQTSIVGISGTTAQFNTALSDGTFATIGTAQTFTEAQRTDITAVDNSIPFNDGNNFTFTATAANVTVTNQTVGQGGVLVVTNASNITGWGTEFNWGTQGAPDLTGETLTTFAYFISDASGANSIKIGIL